MRHARRGLHIAATAFGPSWFPDGVPCNSDPSFFNRIEMPRLNMLIRPLYADFIKIMFTL